MTLKYFAIGSALLAATAAVAHQGVKNPAVKARMDGMSAIAEDIKTLGQMAKGATTFDADVARLAAASIANQASAIPELFEADETDPMTEARPEIWSNFDDFTAKANELEEIAVGLSTSIAVPADLTSAIRTLGANCQSCHTDYRIEK